MFKFFKAAAVSLAALTAGAQGASAATAQGKFWDTGPVGSLGVINAALASTPTATFTSTGIDYPQGAPNVTADTTSLSTFLGTDAPSLSGAGSSTLEGSVFRFTGYLDIAAGMNTFSVSSDDGFWLDIGGVRVTDFIGNRAFGTSSATVDLGAGRQLFDLVYWENGGVTGIEFDINGRSAVLAPVPLPASLPLLVAGLGFVGFMARRKRTA